MSSLHPGPGMAAPGPPGVPSPAPELAAAPVWRREPYRVFFPLGLLLAWAGVLHWLLHGLGLLQHYRPVFHSIAQIQGFLMCFALGFLFTAIPRRTGTPPPSGWQIVVGVIATVGATVAAWFKMWGTSQLLWLVLVAVLIGFVVKRFLSATARRRPPNEFLWLPLSFGMGVVGSLLLGAYGILGAQHMALHYLGQLLLLQGMFLGLIVGVGALVLRLITRGEGPPDAGATRHDDLVRAAHVAGALVLVISFVLETFTSRPAGLALRAVLMLGLLLLSAKLWRAPAVPGWHRWLVWISAWMIPLGYALAAWTPAALKAGMHVVFIGGFALMALSVGLHVTLAHGGYQDLVRGRSWQVPVFGALLLLSALLRALVDYDRERFAVWLAAAAATFLLATVFWAWLVLPRTWRTVG